MSGMQRTKTATPNDRADEAAPHNERFIRRRAVEARTGLSCTTIYELMGKNEFPKPVKISPRIAAWLESEVSAWIDAHVATRADAPYAGRAKPKPNRRAP